MFDFLAKPKEEEELKKKEQDKKGNDEYSSNTINEEDDDQRFIRKDEPQEEMDNEFQEEVEEVIDELKQSSAILPESHHQRNLDRETGGLEEEKDKGISEKDIWDDRSEEVDRMGSHNPYGTSGKKIDVMAFKEKRLDDKKEMKENAAEAAIEARKNRAQSKASFGNNFDSRTMSYQDLSYTARLQQLRQDRGNDGNGGMSR